MTRDELEKHIKLYKNTEEYIFRLNFDFGIDVRRGDGPYNNYNLIIHYLLVSIFGDLNTDLIEEYIFDQWPEMTFDDLCNRLGI